MTDTPTPVVQAVEEWSANSADHGPIWAFWDAESKTIVVVGGIRQTLAIFTSDELRSLHAWLERNKLP